MDNKNELLVRVYFVLLMFVLFAFLIIGRVIKITMVEGDKWRSKGAVNLKWMDNDVDRGDILDVHGNMLATSLPYFDIRMDLLVPSESLFNKNVDSLAICLARLWPNRKSAKQWKSELISERVAGKHGKKKGVSYHYIANGVKHEELDQLKKFPIFRRGRFGGGLIIERKSQREKPFRDIASRTIGEDRMNANKIGIEGSFDKFLRGKTNKQLMKRIKSNLWVPVDNPAEFDAQKGNDIVTTLDMHLQDIVQLALSRGLQSQKARAGTAILMDVKTGAIKAVSNLSRTESGNYNETYNYALGWLSEPGSTIKTASMLALLEGECASLNQKVQVNGGKINFYGQWMHDSENHYKDEMTLAEAFKLSSNVGISNSVDKCFRGPDGVKKFIDYFHQFGLHEKTEIEIEGEGSPYIKNPIDNKKSFWKTTVPWMAHGYEMHLTPLQVLSFYNTIANNGKKMKPYLVDKILDGEEAVHQFKPKVIQESIASLENIEKVQDLLEGVVLSGTGSRLKSDEFTFSGKTGTTRVDYDKDTEFKKYNASFAGYFPAEDPTYSLIVVVYEPRVSFYGGQVAGPIFRNIVEKCHSLVMNDDIVDVSERSTVSFDLDNKSSGNAGDYQELLAFMNVDVETYTKGKWVNLMPKDGQAKIDKNIILKNKVADVTGMGLRDATYILESLGMKVISHGVGKVHHQSISPGTEIKVKEIEIFLE